jgi:MoaA/NifB/PqqE/SkfB family radical SAM enzyme
MIVKKPDLKYLVKRVCYGASRIVPISLQKRLQNELIFNPRKARLGISDDFKTLFKAVFFEVSTKCNGSCPFCPASVQNDTRPETSMPMPLYSKVIDELVLLKFEGRVAYHVNNDPLLFMELPDFIRYARTRLPKAWIQILTNGKALNVEMATALLVAGLNELSINIYNDDLKAETPENIRKFREEILPQFYEEKRIRTGHGPDPEQENIFRFNVHRSRATAIRSTKAGTAPNKKEMSKAPRGFCEHPFTQFNITTDGRVSMCSANHYFTDPMGDVSKQSLAEIWFGESFRAVRKLLLDGNRGALGLCRQCDFYGVDGFDSLPARILHQFTDPES